MELIALYQRTVTGIQHQPCPADAARQARVHPHLLESPDAELALDGVYRKVPGDIVDWPPGLYLDPGSIDCADCIRAADAS